jgi:thiol-disulfide isomerase/thioredoxin
MKIKHTILILSLIIAAAFTAIFLNPEYTRAVPPKINLVPSDYSTGMTWKKAKSLNKPIVINFYVDWCHYCQGFAPVLERLRQQYSSKYSFVFINCEDPQNETLVRNFNIKSYPSLFLFDKNKNKKIQVNNSKYSNLNLLKKDFDKFLK